jgi:all-trans-retinol 13,14-reductase
MVLAETVVPGLRDMVSEQYVSTPHTWQRFTHTPGGSAYGIRKDCRQPLFTMLSPRTPLSNLLLTGQNVMLHGLEGVAMTARQTCDIVLNINNE